MNVFSNVEDMLSFKKDLELNGTCLDLDLYIGNK
jgi:hypothetical protein